MYVVVCCAVHDVLSVAVHVAVDVAVLVASCFVVCAL